MEQFEFHDFRTNPSGLEREWTEIEPNIHQMILNQDLQSGRKTLLQKWHPDTHNVKQNFVHDYIEEIFIVEGDREDTRRCGKFEKGWYSYRKPGMEHGPFYSREGCLMFITCTPVKDGSVVGKA